MVTRHAAKTPLGIQEGQLNISLCEVSGCSGVTNEAEEPEQFMYFGTFEELFVNN